VGIAVWQLEAREGYLADEWLVGSCCGDKCGLLHCPVHPFSEPIYDQSRALSVNRQLDITGCVQFWLRRGVLLGDYGLRGCCSPPQSLAPWSLITVAQKTGAFRRGIVTLYTSFPIPCSDEPPRCPNKDTNRQFYSTSNKVQSDKGGREISGVDESEFHACRWIDMMRSPRKLTCIKDSAHDEPFSKN